MENNPMGHLDRDHVLISGDGKVKLSIADIMLTHHAMVLRDTRMLGQVMDRETGVQPSQTLQLRWPESWSPDAQEFLYSTQDIRAPHPCGGFAFFFPFVKKSPPSECWPGQRNGQKSAFLLFNTR
jgi:hypothetical protein